MYYYSKYLLLYNSEINGILVKKNIDINNF